MKKLGIAFGVVLGLILLGMLVIPKIVDVDQYRPKLVAAANERIQGSLELGKLSLSLWGQIRIEVGGVKLKTASGDPVVSVEHAFFHVPWLSLFSGAPELRFQMTEPSVWVKKYRDGKLNLMSLVPLSAAEKSKETPVGQNSLSSSSAQGSPQTFSSLPRGVSQARLSVEFREAKLIYQDERSALSSELKNLNLVLQDLSLSKTAHLELWSDLNTQMGSVFGVQGLVKLTAQISPRWKDPKNPEVEVSAQLNGDPLRISAASMFEKKAGVPAHASMDLLASARSAQIRSFQAQFFNAELSAQGTIQELSSESPHMDLKIKTNAIAFQPWVELVPLLKVWDLGGSAQMEGSFVGTQQKPQYQALLELKGLTAKAPQLKAQPRFDGRIKLKTDQIEELQVTMKAPGTEVQLQGQCTSFSKPKANFQLTSSGMDLDQLMVFQTRSQTQDSATEKPAALKPVASLASGGQPEIQDRDALFAPLREKPAFKNLDLSLTADLKSLKAKAVQIRDLKGRIRVKDSALQAVVSNLSVFSGSVKGSSQLSLGAAVPAYSMAVQVSGFDLNQAVASQMELFKNTVSGKLTLDFTAQGSSFNTAAALKNLKGTGFAQVQSATFATLDVMRMVRETLLTSIQKVSQKVPGLQGKSLPEFPHHQAAYEVISTHFNLQGGRWESPDFFAKAQVNQGVDLRGSTQVDLLDSTLKAQWEVSDPYNLTHLKDVSIEQAGVRVEHLFAEGSQPVRFQIQVGCTLRQPCTQATEVPEQLARVALKNVAQAVQSKAQHEVKKKAEGLIRNLAPGLENSLKGLFR